MEEFRQRRIVRSTTLADVNPVSVGRVLKPLRVDDDLLGEMLGDDRAFDTTFLVQVEVHYTNAVKRAAGAAAGSGVPGRERL